VTGLAKAPHFHSWLAGGEAKKLLPQALELVTVDSEVNSSAFGLSDVALEIVAVAKVAASVWAAAQSAIHMACDQVIHRR
jgi:hypothetical protein